MKSKQVCGWIILFASIVITLTFWVNETTLWKIMQLMIGVGGIGDGIELIQKKNK